MTFFGWIRTGDDGLTGWRRRRLAQRYMLTAADRHWPRGYNTKQLDPVTGTWKPLEPMKPMGRLTKVEFWLRMRGWMPRTAELLGRIDERKLGR